MANKYSSLTTKLKMKN